jgi:hypothetical protein
MLIVALGWRVGCRMTIHAARIHYDLSGFGEERAGTRQGILDTRELGWRPQLVGLLSRRYVAPEDQQQ